MPANERDTEPSGQSLPAGARLEEFVIEKVLGSGGFGITYLAKDTSLGRRVVIKENLPAQFAWRETVTGTVRPRHTSGGDADDFAWSMTNFLREAETLASLDHPGIVRVLRKFEANGTAYFIMPFVEGVAFDSLIDSNKSNNQSFDEAGLHGLLTRMLDTLGYLHDRGVYHRDIKPGNILITNAGVPVLIDFGSARQRLSDRSMTVVESAGYTPFEQLQSRGNVGPWSDLYALGGTLAKAITGEAPPKANDRIRKDPHVPLAQRSELATRFSTTFLASIDTALAVEETERWRNAGEWQDALRGETAAVVVTPVPPSQPPPRPQRLVESAMRPSAPVMAQRSETQRTPGTQRIDPISPAKKIKPLPWIIAACVILVLGAWAMFSSNSKVTKATKDQPFVNSLGMKFVPAGTSGVLFGTCLTRVKDFEAFVDATGYDAIKDSANGMPAYTLEKEGDSATWKQAGGSWKDPRFPPGHGQNGEHPVVCVSYLDAEAFCAWLTKRDAAKLPSGWRYRLPTDEEWSTACGPTEFPWGENFPPGPKDGNYSGTETMIGPWQGLADEFSKAGRTDGWARTSPVGSFTPNRYGLSDMGGNAWEWCATWYKASLNDAKTLEAIPSLKEDGGGQTARVVRGGSWYGLGRVLLRSAYRNYVGPRYRNGNFGFRVVLVGGAG